MIVPWHLEESRIDEAVDPEEAADPEEGAPIETLEAAGEQPASRG
jgi:hypothetical protein